MFCSLILAVNEMCAMPNMAVFFNSLISCFPDMMLRYYLSYFDMVPVAPIFTGITFAFLINMRKISIISSFYFNLFLTTFLLTILSSEIATFLNT
jgi:hypothetical protein